MAEERFLPISVATLVPMTAIGIDLYHRSDDMRGHVLFRSCAYPLEKPDIDRLHERGIKCLYIPQSDQDSYQAHLRKLAAAEDIDEDVPMAARLESLNEVVRETLRVSFAQNDADQMVADASGLAELACAVVNHEEFAARDLLRVLCHDYTTFAHSANVALYATILAKALGYSEQEMTQIATGGLLHDLGKLEIPDAILGKAGRLSEDEFHIIRKHPVTGFRRLCDHPDLCRGQVMMVYQHHEHVDGGGYPVGLTEDEIHPWAKLCSVVDVFEAVTSHRPYRKPMPRSKAIELLRRDAGTALNSEIVECWASTIQSGSTD